MKGTEEMTSNLLNQIGLGNMDIAYFLIVLLVLIVVLFIFVIVLFIKTSKLKNK